MSMKIRLPEELTAAQMKMVSEIADRYIQAMPRPKTARKWPWILAACLLLIIVYEYGVKTGLTLYAAISCLGLMLVPDQELVFMFIFVFGLYSVIKMPLDRKLGKKTRLIAKFAYINISLIIILSFLNFCVNIFLIHIITYFFIFRLQSSIIYFVSDIFIDRGVAERFC